MVGCGADPSEIEEVETDRVAHCDLPTLLPSEAIITCDLVADIFASLSNPVLPAKIFSDQVAFRAKRQQTRSSAQFPKLQTKLQRDTNTKHANTHIDIRQAAQIHQADVNRYITSHRLISREAANRMRANP